MSRRNLWRLVATILLAVCLSPLVAWIYSRVETAREIAYFRQFEDYAKLSLDDVNVPFVRVDTRSRVPRERLEAWIPDALEPRLLPLFEEPHTLRIPSAILYHPEVPSNSGDQAVPDMRRVFQLTSLETLSIGDNFLLGATVETDASKSDLDLKNLKSLSKLRSLSIAGVRINHAAARSIGSLNILEHLTLRRNSLTDMDLVPIGEMKQLTSLEINSNPITDDGVAYLGRLVNLERLDLSWTQVTRGCLPHLKGMTRLKRPGDSISGSLESEIGDMVSISGSLSESFSSGDFVRDGFQ